MYLNFQQSPSKVSSIGLLNPVFNKQTKEDDNQTELVMDEINSVEGTDSNANININAIFSTNLDKPKKSKKSTLKKKSKLSCYTILIIP